MLQQQDVIQFLQTHRHHTMEGCKFFYKSHTGTFIDADAKTAALAGVSGKEIIHKRDAELRWAKYSDQYQLSDNLALSKTETIIEIEQNFNLCGQEASVLVIKQAVTDGLLTAGLFGASFYIDEMSFASLLQTFDFLQSALSLSVTNPVEHLFKTDTKKMQLTPREQDCANYLCLGMSAREIADNLHLSKRTVESYLAVMKEKLQVRSKSSLIQTLLEDDLVDMRLLKK